ncbi:trichohyalin-like [Oreochromis niloticus]|uniref:trichohyalin-like n=1 Tax=Oreochromis niloticus TaxID=8128 RepID=UPI000905C4C8|nr:trichohyalin-like [Oreochromis niloticus]
MYPRKRSISASSVQRTLQENSDLHAKIKQIEEEKLQLEEKCRQLEARNQELEKQQLLAPYAKFISEVCEGKLDEARQKILFLTKENKTKSAELKETSAQLQCTNATIAKMQGDRQYMEQKNQALQGMLDEALEKMTQFLCLKKEENTQMQDQVKGIKEKHKVLKVRLDETECKNKELLQEKEQQEEEKRILQDLERRNLQLNEFCNTMKDRTPELEGEVLEKLYSKIQRRINEMVKSLSEAIDEMLLDSDNLKRENTEMLAQKQQQEKINEDLQRKLQEITRRNEQLEKIHKEKQQQNTDKRNLLKEMEQKNQALQGMPDEALEQITQFLCLKKEGNTQMQDQVKGIKEKHKVLKFRLDETECKIKELLQEKEQQEEEKRILQDLERRNLQLKEFCNTMKDRTPELEGEVLEKLRSKMQRRIKEMAKKHSEVKNKILLHSNNLKCKNAEMLAQKQQQEKINEDLQRKLQEITRRNEQLEKIHKEKQQQNTDKCNLLKEMEQRCQKLEKEVEETTDQLRTLILEKKVLVEKLMEKKKKRFRFFWRRDTPAFSTFSIFSTADVTSSPSTSVPS